MCLLLASLSRLVLIAANFAFSLFGILLISLGIFWTLRYAYYLEAVPSEYNKLHLVPIFALVVGSLLVAITFQGCVGAFKRIRWMLLLYAGILFAIFVINVGFGIYGLVRVTEDDIRKSIDDQMMNLFLNYDKNKEDAKTVDLIQKNLECCGITSPEWWTSQGFSTPNSCYSQEQHKLFEGGCTEAMLALMKSSVITISILMLIVAMAEGSGAVLALHLSHYIKNTDRTGPLA